MDTHRKVRHSGRPQRVAYVIVVRQLDQLQVWRDRHWVGFHMASKGGWEEDSSLEPVRPKSGRIVEKSNDGRAGVEKSCEDPVDTLR